MESEIFESKSDIHVSFLGATMDEYIHIPKVKVHLKYVITKVRKIVQLFRKSIVKNEKKKLRSSTKKFLLILNCRTRWNSLLSMIQQLLTVKKLTRKISKDISPHLICNDDKVDILSDNVTALEPVKLADSEVNCRQNSTLLTAEGIFRFLINSLKQ